jgi:hypothetical protein
LSKFATAQLNLPALPETKILIERLVGRSMR